jgi:hypothetical protein
VRHWTLTTLREKLIKIGAKVISCARYATFQMAEVAVPRDVFKAIMERMGDGGGALPAINPRRASMGITDKNPLPVRGKLKQRMRKEGLNVLPRVVAW